MQCSQAAQSVFHMTLIISEAVGNTGPGFFDRCQYNYDDQRDRQYGNDDEVNTKDALPEARVLSKTN